MKEILNYKHISKSTEILLEIFRNFEHLLFKKRKIREEMIGFLQQTGNQQYSNEI